MRWRLPICNCFRQRRDWKVENLANIKELSTVPIGTEKEDYLCRQYTIFEKIFRKIRVLTIQQNNPKILVESEMERKFLQKIRSEIVDYLQRQTSFSVWNGTAEISLPFRRLSSFQSPISRQQYIGNGKLHLVWLVCRFWRNSYHYSWVVPTGLF